jgi:ureidoglycolate hydrolase
MLKDTHAISTAAFIEMQKQVAIVMVAAAEEMMSVVVTEYIVRKALT